MNISKDLLSKQPEEPDNPFEGDIFDNRHNFAVSLTGYINSLQQGAVLAIDAPWGGGKTWFGLHWKKHLEDNGYRCLFIDAFRHDYVGDPYMLLVSEMMTLAREDNEKNDLKKAAVNVARVVLPMMTKATLNVAGRMLIGNANLSRDISAAAEEITASGADATSQWLEQQLDAYATEKKTLEAFREILTSFTGKQDKPVVIFVDELDRCRPDFAVHLLEYLKHFFDVPNLVFVLLMNRTQLEAAIRGIYGQDCDASVYLGKFINLFVTFPDVATDSSSSQATYAREMMGRSGLQPTQTSIMFSDCLAAFSTWFDLSFRQIEQAVLSYILNQWKSDMLPLEVAYLLTLKMAHPVLFRGIMEGNQEAHRKAMQLLEEIASNNVLGNVRGATKQDIIASILHAHQLALGEEVDDKHAEGMDLPKHAATISSGVWS